MGTTNIQWTSGPNGEPGYSFNPWIGCRKVAPECANCYAETLDRNRYSKTLDGASKEHPVSHWGSGPRHRTSASNWKQPLKWNQQSGQARRLASLNCPGLSPDGKAAWSHRPRVFCASLSDWLDDENVPIEWFADLLKLIHDTPHLDWLLLTKRPQNFLSRIEKVTSDDTPFMAWLIAWYGAAKGYQITDTKEQFEPPPNVWIGVSAGADQATALAIPARIHFLSCEPMLRGMDTTHAAGFDWIIFGGESGPKARRCDADWIEDGVTFCRERGIAVFVKQLGATPCVGDVSHSHGWEGTNVNWNTGRIHLKDSHGGDMAEWPEDLRVREFPTTEPR